MPNILSLLENALDYDLSDEKIDSLTNQELEQFAYSVNEFYESWRPEAVSDETMRFYPGGWVASNLPGREQMDYLYSCLIYYPSIVIHDPIEEWFSCYRSRLEAPPGAKSLRGLTISTGMPITLGGNGYGVFLEQPERTKDHLKLALSSLRELAPLIREGVVIPVPQIKIMYERQQAILAAVRHDIRNSEFAQVVRNPIDEQVVTSDHVRGLLILPNDGWAPGHESRGICTAPSYFLNKTLAIADEAGARYVPPSASDAALLYVKMDELRDRLKVKDVEFKVAPALTTTRLPYFSELDAKTLLKIRRDEQAFNEWRAQLRTYIRQIESLPAEGDRFSMEAKQILEDGLLPLVNETNAAVNRSASLKRITKDNLAVMTFGGVAALGASAFTPEAPTASLIATGIGGSLGWIYNMLFRSKPSGANAIIATLASRV